MDETLIQLLSCWSRREIGAAVLGVLVGHRITDLKSDPLVSMRPGSGQDRKMTGKEDTLGWSCTLLRTKE